MSAPESQSLAAVVGRLLSAVAQDQVSLIELVEAAGLNPATAFVDRSLRDIDLRREDLRPFNFTGADLSGSDFRGARISGVRFTRSVRDGAIGLPDLTPTHPAGAVRVFEVESSRGVHARPTARIIKVIQSYGVTATVSYNNNTADAASIMGLLMLDAMCGAMLRFDVSGDRCEEALDALGKLFEDEALQSILRGEPYEKK